MTNKFGCIKSYANTWIYSVLDQYYKSEGNTNWTYTEASVKLGVDKATVSKYCRGVMMPTEAVIKKIVKIANSIDIKCDYNTAYSKISMEYMNTSGKIPHTNSRREDRDMLDVALATCGFSNREIADMAGETYKWISNHLCGLSKPDDKVISHLSSVTDLSKDLVKQCLDKRHEDRLAKARENRHKREQKKTLAKSMVESGMYTSEEVEERIPDIKIPEVPKTLKECEPKLESKLGDVVEKEVDDNGGITFTVKPAGPTADHIPASFRKQIDRIVDHICKEIKGSDLRKLLYGSSLTPDEYIEAYDILSHGPGRTTTYYNGAQTTASNFNEAFVKKITLAIIKKVAEEMKEE